MLKRIYEISQIDSNESQTFSTGGGDDSRGAVGISCWSSRCGRV